jgi:hypothetical protein
VTGMSVAAAMNKRKRIANISTPFRRFNKHPYLYDKILRKIVQALIILRYPVFKLYDLNHKSAIFFLIDVAMQPVKITYNSKAIIRKKRK